ncbi:hypothetical protein V8E53_007653 [Lactarius tabidus]
MTKGVISSQATFSLSSKTTDLDEKFTEILGSMDLDTAGGLMEVLSRQEFLQVVISPWKDFALDWVARCSTDGKVDWNLFSKVFKALVKLMNALSRHFTTCLDASAVSDPLPEICLNGFKSSSVPLASCKCKDLRTPSREFRTLLQTYRTSDTDFPVHTFVDSLYEISVGCIEGSRNIEETKREVESDLSEAATQLRSVFLFHSRPKRPPPDDDDDDETFERADFVETTQHDPNPARAPHHRGPRWFIQRAASPCCDHYRPEHDGARCAYSHPFVDLTMDFYMGQDYRKDLDGRDG